MRNLITPCPEQFLERLETLYGEDKHVQLNLRLDEFFDRGRRNTNPAAFMTRLKVGAKLVDAKAVATLYRSRVSGGAIALLVLAALVAIIVALVVSNMGGEVLDWAVQLWNSFATWVQGLLE